MNASSADLTRIAFIDETEGKVGMRTYKSAVACVWSTNQLRPFRVDLMRAVNKLINPVGVLNRFPDIHGSNMAPNYFDEIKFQLYELTANLLVQYGVGVYRVGYFDEAPGTTRKFDALSFSIFALCAEVSRKTTDDLSFVYELNSSKHIEISKNYNDTEDQFAGASIGYENISIPNLERVLGRFYCDKKNVHMNATDIAAYYLLQRDNAMYGEELSLFRKRVLSTLQPIQGLVAFDEVIQLNDWPIKTIKNGPPRYMFPIEPSDTQDIHMSEGFMAEIQRHWTQQRRD